MKQKPGRPKKTFIVVLKTLIWYEYVSEKVLFSNLERNIHTSDDSMRHFKASTRSLDEYFNQEESNTWYTYSVASHSPNKDTLELVDLKIPTSSIYFNHPIWNFLEILPRGKIDLQYFYDQLSKETQQIIDNKKIIFNFQNLNNEQTNDYLKFENLLEFYSYIIYQYYKAKFELNNTMIEDVIRYFEINTNPIIDQFGATGYYFLKLLFLHFTTPKEINFKRLDIESCLKKIGLLEHIVNAITKNPLRYDPLENRFKDYRLDGEQYEGSKIYIDLEDDGYLYVGLDLLQLLKDKPY